MAHEGAFFLGRLLREPSGSVYLSAVTTVALIEAPQLVITVDVGSDPDGAARLETTVGKRTKEARSADGAWRRRNSRRFPFRAHVLRRPPSLTP